MICIIDPCFMNVYETSYYTKKQVKYFNVDLQLSCTKSYRKKD